MQLCGEMLLYAVLALILAHSCACMASAGSVEEAVVRQGWELLPANAEDCPTPSTRMHYSPESLVFITILAGRDAGAARWPPSIMA